MAASEVKTEARTLGELANLLIDRAEAKMGEMVDAGVFPRLNINHTLMRFERALLEVATGYRIQGLSKAAADLREVVLLVMRERGYTYDEDRVRVIVKVRRNQMQRVSLRFT